MKMTFGYLSSSSLEPILWCSKKQIRVAQLTVKTKYTIGATVTNQVI